MLTRAVNSRYRQVASGICSSSRQCSHYSGLHLLLLGFYCATGTEGHELRYVTLPMLQLGFDNRQATVAEDRFDEQW